MAAIWTAFLIFSLATTFAAGALALLHEMGFRPLRRLATVCRRPIGELALVAAVAGGFIQSGSTKGTNGVPDRGTSPFPQGQMEEMLDMEPVVLRGGAADVSEVVTNADWLDFGAYADWFHIEPGGWCFRFGTDLVERVTVLASGEICADLRDVSNRISVLGLPLSIVPTANWRLIPQPLNLSTPQPSLFWHSATPSNSLLLTWENALVNRDTNLPVTVQAELFPNGAATLRYDFSGLADTDILSNAAVRIWRDGVLSTNAITDGGQGLPALPETLEVSFSAPQITGTNTLDEVYARLAGGDSNAYYFAEVAVAKGPARIEVRCDGNPRSGSTW